MVRNAWSGLLHDAAALATRWPPAVRHTAGTLHTVRDTGGGLVRFGRHLGGTPRLTIEAAIGPHRRWAHSSAAIDDVRVIRKSFGGTLNDVVLAAVAGGYRTLLLERGEDADAAVVRTLVPVSLRAEDAHGLLDNRVSAMLLELPVDIENPIERLKAVIEQMAGLKQSHMAEAGGVVTAAGDLAPPMVVGTVTRLVTHVQHRLPQRSVNTVTTNVPGPQFPLYCLGREMVAYYPFVPIMHGVRIGTAILSYNGQLSFGITGDFDTAPDVDVLASAIATGITRAPRSAPREVTAVSRVHQTPLTSAFRTLNFCGRDVNGTKRHHVALRGTWTCWAVTPTPTT